MQRRTTRFFAGLDLGPPAEPTALAVLERPFLRRDGSPGGWRPAYALRHLERFPPGTGFPAIVSKVVQRIASQPLYGVYLLADYTGVGRAVVRFLTDAFVGQVDCHFSEVALTAGHETGPAVGDGLLVPKTELIGTVQVLLQARRLRIATDLPDAPLLVRELEAYRPKVVLATNETLAWREGLHDDLVFAVALAAWGGERVLGFEQEL